MTIHRAAKLIVPNDLQRVTETIRDILDKNTIYRHTHEQNDGTVFVTIVKTHWWLLGIPMTVTLSPQNTATDVTAEITSQPWITGDVFGFYARYIGAFLAAVKETCRLC